MDYVAELYEERGYSGLERSIGIVKPYDLLIEYLNKEGPMRLYIEVKSHLKKVLIAELTDSETMFAEANPYNYIVCNAIGLEDEDPATWFAICGVCAELSKTIVTSCNC